MFIFAMRQEAAESTATAGKTAAGPVPFPEKTGDAKANAQWVVKTFGKDLNTLPIGQRERFQEFVFQALDARGEKDGLSRQIDYLHSAMVIAAKHPALVAKVEQVLHEQTLYGRALTEGGRATGRKDYAGAGRHLAKAHKIAAKTLSAPEELKTVNRYLLDLARDARGAAGYDEDKGNNANAAKLYRIAGEAYALRGDKQDAEACHGRADTLGGRKKGERPFIGE